MRRLYVRILVALLATAVLSFLAFIGVFFRMTAPALNRLAQSVQMFVLDEAVQALAEGGTAKAAAVLETRGAATNASHYLTDPNGLDLVTGADRSSLLVAMGSFPGPRAPDGRPIFVRASDDGRHRLITLATPPFGFVDVLPYYLLLVLTVAALCWILAVHIVSPLRSMATVVEAFGRGRLTARTGVTRRDEIGDLARAVDGMAQRIELLVSSERRLLQDVSHELRSPLTRLNMNVELSRTMDDRDAAASRLQRDVDRLTRLVGTLLEVTRLEGEGLRASTTPVDIEQLVNDVVTDCDREAQLRDVRLNVGVQPAVAHGDVELLRRAVENVVRNAVRYAPPASAVDIEVALAGDTVTVSVRDYGPGVPDEALHKLGTPFFRVDDARDAAAGGVGLGLAIARRAIERHGGRMTAVNAEPGLRVTIIIPRGPLRSHQFDESVSDQPPSSHADTEGHNRPTA